MLVFLAQHRPVMLAQPAFRLFLHRLALLFQQLGVEARKHLLGHLADLVRALKHLVPVFLVEEMELGPGFGIAGDVDPHIRDDRGPGIDVRRKKIMLTEKGIQKCRLSRLDLPDHSHPGRPVIEARIQRFQFLKAVLAGDRFQLLQICPEEIEEISLKWRNLHSDTFQARPSFHTEAGCCASSRCWTPQHRRPSASNAQRPITRSTGLPSSQPMNSSWLCGFLAQSSRGDTARAPSLPLSSGVLGTKKASKI